MKAHLLRTQGRALERCDQCHEQGGVREYLLPYRAKAIQQGHYEGRYRDLCGPCLEAIERDPLPYVRPDTDLALLRSDRH